MTHHGLSQNAHSRFIAPASMVRAREQLVYSWIGLKRMDHMDCIVIGAGVVGLAIARRLAQAGREVLLLERAPAIGTETSSRNSEVIHAGIYYPPGSLKAKFCIEGRDLLYAYLNERDLPFRQCGKLIVAANETQGAALQHIRDNAERCGAGTLRPLTRQEARQLEPQLACHSALLSTMTGIIDTHALLVSFQGEAEGHGATIALMTEVTSLVPGPDGIQVVTRTTGTDDSFRLHAKTVINAAGLWAPDLAASTTGLRPAYVPKPRYARGTWYGVPGRSVFSRLIYPVPEPGGLGIHLTIDLGGGMRFGPDVEWIDSVDYQMTDKRTRHFTEAIRRYWPAVPHDALSPISCGVRPKMHGPDEPAADFRIDGPAEHGMPGLINLFGIESPGLTSCMAIAEHVARLAIWP